MTAEQYLRTYLHLLWRRKWSIAFCTVLAAAAAVGYESTKTPLYRSSAEVLLQPRQSESLFEPGGDGNLIDPTRDTATQILVMTGEPVRELVADKLGSAPRVTASAVGNTSIVRVTAISADPERARDIANAYASSYIEYRRSSDIDDLAAASKTIQEKITDLQRQVDGFDAQVANAPPPDREAVRSAVQSERDGLIAQIVGLKQTFDRIQLNTSLNRGGAQVVTQAQVPSTPFEPQPVRFGIAAGIVGLLLGVVIAFVRELLDDTVKTKEDVEHALPGVKVIGAIPAVSRWNDKKRTYLAAREDPDGSAGEAYRTLRTSIQFMGLDQPLRTLQVTSPQAGEGKTTTLANLAVVLARAGQRVIVVCCDLRRPRVHEFFGLSNEVGFTSVLLGEVPLSQALQPVEGEERLSVLASGPEPPNPSELLSGRRMVEVLVALQGLADIVLVDSPPVLPVADAAVIATRVDATVLVLAARNSTRKQAQRTVERLRQVEANIVGCVINRARGDAGDGASGYGYGYGYGGYGAYRSKSSSKRESERERKRKVSSSRSVPLP